MALMRLFVDETLAQGVTVRLEDKPAHYVLHVLRLQPGDALAIFNGRDGEFLARLTERTKQAALFTVAEPRRAPAPEADLLLAFAPLKRGPTDLVIEKATELGVTAIQPVFTTNTGAETVRLERWEAIAREAAEQCERLSVPALLEPVPLARLLGEWPSERRLLFADARAEGLVSPAEALSDDPAAAALFIGPEGGFDPREVQALSAHPAGRGVTLGPRVLRAETAVIAGLALVQAAWGDRRAS